MFLRSIFYVVLLIFGLTRLQIFFFDNYVVKYSGIYVKLFRNSLQMLIM